MANLLLDVLGNAGIEECAELMMIADALGNYHNIVCFLKNQEDERNQYLGDDFIPDVRRYNLAGAIYPSLSREKRDEVLDVILNRMDKINYFFVCWNHTPFIREPLLLSDIGISRNIYWPGLHDEEQLWKGKGFDEVREKIIDENGLFLAERVRSDFLVAYALLRSDLADFGEKYARVCHKKFLDRVLKGIAALRFFNAQSEEEIKKGRERLKVLLPESVHEKIERFREEADWTAIHSS